jgi:hypothetical protein
VNLGIPVNTALHRELHTHTFFHDLHLDVVSGLSTKPGQTIVFQPHYVKGKQKQMSDCNKVLYLCKVQWGIRKVLHG